ncbi:phospholipase A [Dokdonella sp.]|uniref:phospholipase A n=1 Tax=Dokdonella sp. TaxID=2291710 RepID=UPI00378350C4
MKCPFLLLALSAIVPLSLVSAQTPDPLDIRACTAIDNDAQRLACYDSATHRDDREAQRAADEHMRATGVFTQPDQVADVPASAPQRSLLDSRWELDPSSKLGTFNLRSYRPVYVMPVFATSRLNTAPHSPNPNNTATEPAHLQNIEAKFQFSLKTKIVQDLLGDGDLWMGYTQSSRWQVYNNGESRPFRETDYEPEALLVYGTSHELLGWNLRLLDIGINHQSNGRSDPYSRSWNRIVADIGFERGDWTLMLRPWWRIPESRGDDNNPDIADHVGRGEVTLLRNWNNQTFGLTLRHSLRGGDANRGSARFSWSVPIDGKLRGYVELFHGYGESLIDYNHEATYLGVGLSLLDWY